MTKKDESLSLGSHRRPGSPSSAASTVRRRQRPALYDTGHGKLTGSPDRPDQASRAEAKAQRNMAAEEPASRSHYGRQPLATTVSVARTGDYEVGYRKPPVHTRFKKGQSGNPRGRKKGSKNLRTIVKEQGQKLVEVTENGRTRRISKTELVVTRIYNDAARGDQRAIANYLKLTEKSGLMDADPPPESTEGGPAGAVNLINMVRRVLGDNSADPYPGE